MKKAIQDHRGVWVFAEQRGGELSDVGLELIGKASELSEKLDCDVTAMLLGQDAGPMAKKLIAHGADRVLLAEAPELKDYRTLAYTKVITDMIREGKPEVVIYGASVIGRDLAPRVASVLQTGLTADCTDLQIGDYEEPVTKKIHKNILWQIRPAFGGNMIATIVSPEHRPQMATVREGVMKVLDEDPSRQGEIVPFKAELSTEHLIEEILERILEDRDLDLKGARIVVSGGAGVGGSDGFELIRKLADTVGGVVGASRAAVDGGFIDKSHQVGQTGTTVRPALYIACGISGQVQHRAGMQEAGKIVAINTDPDAPIFSIAHYGIVGDLFEVVPALIKAYKEK